MALSGRMVHGKVPAWTNPGMVVILNEVGKSGILRILGAYSGATFNLKIEIDGVVIYNAEGREFFGGNSNEGLVHGMAVYSHRGTSTDTAPSQGSRLVNIPFNDSVKVTLTNTAASGSYSLQYTADYALDIKQGV